MRICIAIVLILAAHATVLPAQWSLTPEVGLAAFGGSGRDSSGLRMGPTRATTVALRFGWQSPHLGAGIRVLAGSSGLGISDGNLSVIQEHQIRLFEVAGVLSWPLARIGTSSRLRLETGPALDIWAPEQASTRSRMGAIAAALWIFPVSPRLEAMVRFEAALSRSLFGAADLPDGAARRNTWRRGVSFALARQL